MAAEIETSVCKSKTPHHRMDSGDGELFFAIRVLSNINFQSGLGRYREVVIPDDDALKPTFYQGFIVGILVVSFFEKYFLKRLQFLSNVISGCDKMFVNKCAYCVLRGVSDEK